MRTPLKTEALEQANNLTTRERMAIYLITMLLRIISPTEWKHEMDKPLDEMLSTMSKGSK